jgi:hypothetical protein
MNGQKKEGSNFEPKQITWKLVVKGHKKLDFSYYDICINIFTSRADFQKAAGVIAAAKRHIPLGYRNQYIPGGVHQCDELYERFSRKYWNLFKEFGSTNSPT